MTRKAKVPLAARRTWQVVDQLVANGKRVNVADGKFICRSLAPFTGIAVLLAD